MLNIVCIGAGVMSSAFAVSQRTRNKVSIIPAPFDSNVVSGIEFERYDKRLDISWPDVPFVDKDIKEFDLIVVGVSSQGIPWAQQIIKELFEVKKVPILLLTKGLIEKDGEIVTLPEYLELNLKADVLSVTGPCIAKLLAKQRQTEIVISGKFIKKHMELIEKLQLPFYKIEVTEDYIGASWSAGLKNVYAILIARASNNLNTRSALFAQSLEEMANWVVERGGKAETVYGLSGLGDLYVTCQGGRNGRLGQLLADGLTINDILAGPMKGVTVEGVELAVMLIDAECYNNKPLFDEMATLLDS